LTIRYSPSVIHSPCTDNMKDRGGGMERELCGASIIVSIVSLELLLVARRESDNYFDLLKQGKKVTIILIS